MKRQIFFSLFLLAFFCAAPVFAQGKSTEVAVTPESSDFVIKKEKLKSGEEPIYTEFVRLNYLLVGGMSGCRFPPPSRAELDSRPDKKFLTRLKKDLSDRGELEFDERSQTVIITDTQSNIDMIRDFINSVDWPGNTLEQILGESNASKEEIVTDFIKLKNLNLNWGTPPFIGTKAEANSEMYENSAKFINFLRKTLSLRGAIEFDNRNQTLIVTDEQSRIKIIADFVKLLDESGFTLEEIVNNPSLEIK